MVTFGVTMNDPRKFKINAYGFPVYALTSLSWLLPVELNTDGSAVNTIHYDKIISPQFTSQEYGIEDPRISFIDGRYYMTTCCVSSERHSTILYVSDDGVKLYILGIVLDHQNKDMLLFEGQINNNYYALTRPWANVILQISFIVISSGCSDSRGNITRPFTLETL